MKRVSFTKTNFSDHVFTREQNFKMRTISTKRVNSKYKMLYFAKWIHEKARDTNNMPTCSLPNEISKVP